MSPTRTLETENGERKNGNGDGDGKAENGGAEGTANAFLTSKASKSALNMYTTTQMAYALWETNIIFKNIYIKNIISTQKNKIPN